MIVKTLESDARRTRRTGRRARWRREVGLTQNAVLRIWQAFGLQPHRQETFKLSTDPQFIDKVHDIVGLYLNPPERAVVLCVDEKTQIQALGSHRADPADAARAPLSAPPTTTSAPAPRASTRPWISRTGKVIGRLHCRHRAIEFQKFLQTHRPRGPRPPPRASRARQQLHPQDADDPDAGSPRTRGSSCTSPRPAARGSTSSSAGSSS